MSTLDFLLWGAALAAMFGFVVTMQVLGAMLPASKTPYDRAIDWVLENRPNVIAVLFPLLMAIYPLILLSAYVPFLSKLICLFIFFLPTVVMAITLQMYRKKHTGIGQTEEQRNYLPKLYVTAILVVFFFFSAYAYACGQSGARNALAQPESNVKLKNDQTDYGLIFSSHDRYLLVRLPIKQGKSATYRWVSDSDVDTISPAEH